MSTMSRIIAAIDNSAASAGVLRAALAMAPIVGASVEAVHVSEDSSRTAHAAAEKAGVPLQVLPGEPLQAIAALAGASDVSMIVVGAHGSPLRTRTGHLALALANQLDKPILAVPPKAVVPRNIRRMLIAMEGTSAKAKKAPTAITLVEPGSLEILAVHVDDSIPSFSDQVGHETEAFVREFLARYLPGWPKTTLRTRIGVPADEILTETEQIGADVLAVGWPQTTDAERGIVARELLQRSRIPVLLIGVA